MPYSKLWLLVVLSLCIIAIFPLVQANSPCTHDGGAHYFRVVAMRQALRDGILFTRFLPDLAFGYGYPFFNYRAALPYYVILVLHLTGMGLPLATNLTYVLSILGAALGAYLAARDLFGPSAGLVAAVAYAYAPYQFLNALERGNLPESIALALLPFILWAFRRLVITGRQRWFLASVLSLTTLYLTHNISSILFTPFLIVYLFVLWLVHRSKGFWMQAGGALILGMALAAFFLVPALLEKNYVQLHMSYSTRNNDFHNNFVPLDELFSPPRATDTSLLNPPTQIHLGLAQVVLGGVGLIAGMVSRRDREQRATLAFFAIGATAMIWMITPSSMWLWERIPLFRFVQFPWRLTGRAILPLALLTGACARAHPKQHTSRAKAFASYSLPAILVALLILAALPYTYPPNGYCAKAPHPTINDLFAYEQRTERPGLAASGSFFPIWVKERPTDSPLTKQYTADSTVARFDETILPEGTSIVEADYGPNRAHVVIKAPATFRARYLAFYFPGWCVAVDNVPVGITPTDPEGLISFDVPAGHHTIEVRFGETPLRLACDIVSLLSLGILFVIAIRYPQIANPESRISNLRSQGAPPFVVHCSLFTVALLLLAFKLAIVDQAETIFRHSSLQPDGTLPGVQYPLNRSYADGLTLIGYDQDRKTVPADGVLRVDLYLTAYARPNARYQTVIHLVGPDGLRWSRPDTFRPRGYTDYVYTTIWSPGIYALDSHEIEPLPGTPPGTYDIVLTVFDRDTLAPLSLLNEQGQPIAPDLALGQVTLTRPRRPAAPPDDNRLDLALGNLTLLAAGLDRDQAAPGDLVLITTFWRAEKQMAEDTTSRLTLLAPDGTLVAEYDLALTADWYPTSMWQPGDIWRGQHLFHLPADLDSGTYSWQISLSPANRPAGLPSTIRITAPPHTFAPATLTYTLNTTLGELATLVGFDIEPATTNLQPRASVTITLTWRAEETPDTSYHVFLHLLDPEGRLAAQSDGVPADWTRPTTGWLPGEYITDVHHLAIPADLLAGEYTLLTGLYDPRTSARLTDPSGSGTTTLLSISVK
jgi:hypothetical protein